MQGALDPGTILQMMFDSIQAKLSTRLAKSFTESCQIRWTASFEWKTAIHASINMPRCGAAALVRKDLKSC